MIHLSYTFSDLLKSFRDQLSTSNEIEDYCQANFSKSLLIGVGHDERREWGAEDAPFITLIPTYLNSGITQSIVSFSFDFDVGISDNTFEDYDENNVIEMQGFYKLDGLVNLVLDACTNHAVGRNAIADVANISYDTSTFFPLHIATMSVTVEAQTVLGAKMTLGG